MRRWLGFSVEGLHRKQDECIMVLFSVDSESSVDYTNL